MDFNGFVLAAGTGSSILGTPVFLFLALFLIWYFLVIRPQQTQRRNTQQMLDNLKTGDKVIAVGGVYGTVTGFRDPAVQLQIAEGVKIHVTRSAIQGLQPEESKPEGNKNEPTLNAAR